MSGPGEVPLASVVMPVRDGMPFLPEAVDSILGQTLGAIELIVIDDGSRDGSADFLSGRAGSDPRVRPQASRGRGISAALNEGIAAARGAFIVRLDADDRAAPDRIARQIAFLHDHPRHVGVGSAARTIDGSGRATGRMAAPPAAETVRDGIAHGAVLLHPTACLRREPVLAAGLYRPPFDGAEDYDLWLRLLAFGPLSSLDAALIDYRVHPGQESTVKDARGRIAAFLAAAMAWRRSETGAEPDLPAHWPHEALAAASSLLGDRATRPLFPLARLVGVVRRVPALDPALTGAARLLVRRITATALREGSPAGTLRGIRALAGRSLR